MLKPKLEPVECKGKINTSDARRLEHIQHSIRLGLPQVKPFDQVHEEIVLCGGGPSLKSEFAALEELHGNGCKIVSTNNAHDWLMARGIQPFAHVMLDARPTNVRFVQNPVPGCRYLLANQCHPSVFEALADQDCWIWHPDTSTDAEREELESYYKGRFMIVEGGSTVILRAIMLLRILGFAKIHMFGFDSCYLDGEHHAYAQPENEGEKVVTLTSCGREFRCSPWQAKQYEDFLGLFRHRGHLFELTIYGDGLPAHMLRTAATRRYQWKDRGRRLWNRLTGRRHKSDLLKMEEV